MPPARADTQTSTEVDKQTESAPVEFETRIPVRFQHVDGAGLIFYPRYFEMVNQVVEDWFGQALGLDFRTMHVERRSGVPTVHIETEFPAPARLGDVLLFRLRVLRVGETAVDLDIRASNAKRECLRVRSTLVFVDLNGPRAKLWPSELTRRMARYLKAPEAL